MTKKQTIQLLVVSLLSPFALLAQPAPVTEQQDRWEIRSDGSITWQVNGRLPHNDHVEMSGEKVSLWLRYGVDAEGRPSLDRTMVFPTFRMLPVRTIASMTYNVTDNDLPRVLINDKLLRPGVYNASVMEALPEQVTSVRMLKGILSIESRVGKDKNLLLRRTIFPSAKKAMVVENWSFINLGNQPVKIEMEYLRREVKPAKERSTPAQHSFLVTTQNAGQITLQPNQEDIFSLMYQAITPGKSEEKYVLEEYSQRAKRVDEIQSKLQLETPDNLLNTAFNFAKLRATESIYLTKGGYMHGPGGLRYYAAIWANDQAEYVNPFFAFLGDDIGNKSAMNSYHWFAKYMNPEYKPIPSSIIAEGDAFWHGAKDRGDMAMIAYGAGRYALANGNVDSAKALWPLIGWCLEYLNRKINANGVVASNSDELENRFPAGDANLHTSILYYDALRSAGMLCKELKLPASQIKMYAAREKAIRANIEKHFGATVEGFKTYRYYAGNDTLRAWICGPLTVDIFDRKEGTIAALFSPRLWTEDGLASLAGNKTFWDRSTLYALRGVFAAGETQKALDFLQYYSRRRLLGEHVPYPVEAFPEGNQRHLSAESGLYCRIFTEGIFGMRPVGFNSFDCSPKLPAAWQEMALKNIHSFGHEFDLKVKRGEAGKLDVIVTENGKEKKYTVKEGGTVKVSL
ncbi:hypothetical protein [Pseudobacter ginsenosidimutans]|uniref:Uncharacterized protein n=1 Tax=Pseudobacter ginsenosidimutans TaxID=661488 RepID=A0A4V2F1S7_9BACT|nr:hypothetical protein [Pseudobacter ginsenosidimutans]QEC43434.1 hypothetical protein FSB84_17705 [Pseudobacter ginsenosidimutans]RZS74816.1 hypothetical protein EV199_0667 [Pseudobacter ginsenosidimutans]